MMKGPLDWHIPGHPEVSLRGFLWNAKALGIRWWLACATRNLASRFGRGGNHDFAECQQTHPRALKH